MIEIQFQGDPLLTILAYSFMLVFMIVADRALSRNPNAERTEVE